MTEPAVAAEEIHKTYVLGKHRIPVLRGAGLTVAAGERVSVVGASGAGKSTLLHILAGLDRPDRGAVRVAGVDVYRASASRRSLLRATQLGFVFQSYHLLPEMDVAENVMLPGLARRSLFASWSSIRARAMALLDAVGLAERAAHRPMELSGGEQQRVALARALMNDPAVILADEPTGNLDDATGRQVLDHLFALTRDGGHTLVMVTHNRRIAGACDRMLRLEDGCLRGEEGRGARGEGRPVTGEPVDDDGRRVRLTRG